MGSTESEEVVAVNLTWLPKADGPLVVEIQAVFGWDVAAFRAENAATERGRLSSFPRKRESVRPVNMESRVRGNDEGL